MSEIKYRKDSDAEIYKCVITFQLESTQLEAKIIYAELGLLIKV